MRTCLDPEICDRSPRTAQAWEHRGMTRIFIATREGLHIVDGRGNAEAVQHDGRSITAIMRDGPQLWAIVDGREIWHSPDTDWTEITALESGLDGHLSRDDRRGAGGHIGGSVVPPERRDPRGGLPLRRGRGPRGLVHAVGRTPGDPIVLGVGRRRLCERARRRDRPHRRPWQDVEPHDRHRRRRASGRDRGGAGAGRVRRRPRDEYRSGRDLDDAERRASMPPTRGRSSSAATPCSCRPPTALAADRRPSTEAASPTVPSSAA